MTLSNKGQVQPKHAETPNASVLAQLSPKELDGIVGGYGSGVDLISANPDPAFATMMCEIVWTRAMKGENFGLESLMNVGTSLNKSRDEMESVLVASLGCKKSTAAWYLDIS